MLEGDSEARKRFESLYGILLTANALIVTVSGVSYLDAGTIIGIHGILAYYIVVMGFAVILLISSALIYSVAHLDAKRCRIHAYRMAFALLILSPIVSSSLLVAETMTLVFGAEGNSSVTFIVLGLYWLIGVIAMAWFLFSRAL